jgi:hypothetical protein
MNFEDTILSEIVQAQKNKYSQNLLVEIYRTGKFMTGSRWGEVTT